MYRAIDSTGATIDFLLSALRDAVAAKRLFRKALSDPSHPHPRVINTVHAPGYGRLNDAVREAMAMAARHEALLLDPVYTGKAMAGLVAHVRSRRIAAGSRVLFLHTGGLPALFAYADKLGSWLTKAPPAPRWPAGRKARPRTASRGHIYIWQHNNKPT